MKKVLPFMAFAVSMFVASNVNAATLTDVGDYDELIASTVLGNSGTTTEESWVEGVLGFDVTYEQLTGDVSGGDQWVSVTGGVTGDYAFDLSAYSPDYYVVKVGVGTNDPIFTHYLFDNQVEMDWAFVNLVNSFGEGVVIANIGKVSHVGVTDGGGDRGGCLPGQPDCTPSTVPVPAAVWLFGSGLIGLVGVARRKA